MKRLGHVMYRYTLRGMLLLYHGWLWLSSYWQPDKASGKSSVILATATFYSQQWIHAHLAPMAGASECDKVIMVATSEVPEIDKVEARYPPVWMKRLFGAVGSRLLYFSYLSFRLRPDVLVGFHLLLNGLWALAIARLLRLRAVYICGGGPREVRGGGIETENRIFSRLASPDPVIEQRLLDAVGQMHAVVTMGEGAKAYFRTKGVRAPIYVIAGGFDEGIYYPDESAKKFDFILVGRLSDVKRVDRFLGALARVKASKAEVSAVIVGDGPDTVKLRELCCSLGIEKNVFFAGWQNNVADWLRQSRCMVLSSDSEGLSQALIQAMMCGLPAVVSDVGDLGEVIKNNENGYLIDELDETNFAAAMLKIVSEPELHQQLADTALASSRIYNIQSAAQKWNELLTELPRSAVLNMPGEVE